MARAAVALLLCGLAGSATAAPDDYLSRLPVLVQKRIEELTAARTPKLVPPTPVPVTWKATRMGAIDLGAPLGAFAAADLDGDGKSELYVVTAREVVAFALRNGKPAELGRVAFEGDRAVPAPRDVVATAIVEGTELVAASSAWVKELRVTLANGKLAARAGEAGFLVCPGERWHLVPGRNYFPGDFYGVRCRSVVDPSGAPMELRGLLAITGKLAVETKIASGTGKTEHGQPVGTAFELADVDRNGQPELIVSSFVAPGDPDVVQVHTAAKRVFQKKFNGGVVGIAVADNGRTVAPTVIVAVRLAGATRIDLWRLN
jgi:hypothetical protein